MARISDIYDVINGAAPFDSQMIFDNSGLLVGDASQVVTRALLCLDITEPVIQEAVSINANLIISHHPVIFDPLRSLNSREPAYLLAKNGIAALCCHTNLDRSPVCGVNVALADRLGLRNVRAEDAGEDGILFSGECDPMKPWDFATMAGQRLGAPVQWCAAKSLVSRVFLCSGAGGDLVDTAARLGADAFLTGEMKHHEALRATFSGMTCVVAGHYQTEIVYRDYFAAYLKKRIPNTTFLVSKSEFSPLVWR